MINTFIVKHSSFKFNLLGQCLWFQTTFNFFLFSLTGESKKPFKQCKIALYILVPAAVIIIICGVIYFCRKRNTNNNDDRNDRNDRNDNQNREASSDSLIEENDLQVIEKK